MCCQGVPVKTYLLNIVIWIDQGFNVLIGGSPDETLSAHAHRRHPNLAQAINTIFWWQWDHCKAAYEVEVQRKQLPKEYQ